MSMRLYRVCGLVVAGTIAIACANGSGATVDDGTGGSADDGGSTSGNDAGAGGSSSGGGDSSGGGSPDSGGSSGGGQDASAPDSWAADSASPPDSSGGGGNVAQCDMNNPIYVAEYGAAAASSNPPLCANGCTASQCCALFLCVNL